MRSERNTSKVKSVVFRYDVDRTIPWMKSTLGRTKSLSLRKRSAAGCVKAQVRTCVVLILSTLSVLAAEKYQLRARVDLVVVPTSVRDSKGNLIAGLTEKDFT